jgi:hypothetical protein
MGNMEHFQELEQQPSRQERIQEAASQVAESFNHQCDGLVLAHVER